MKKLLPLTLTVLLSASVTSVQAMDNWYVGASYNAQEFSVSGRDFNTAGLIAGYQFTEHFALEGRYAQGTSGYSTYVQSQLNNELLRYKEEIGDQASIMFKASYPLFETFSVYGLAGYSRTTLDISNHAGVFDENENLTSYIPNQITDTFDGLAYGVGLSYKLTEHLNVFVDYQVLPDFAPANSNFSRSWKSTTFGINYAF
ncbi:opacity protein [Idiomarina sp. A28L]|uniref:porin family protein n=1 Tax=Idiomarina sp. A28L TaxID=1036674 RepID=UPI0002138CCD|nr:porin family protein [Idiomarina sp. A28L]EGN74629.1 opacity protein [Idiomarina sp. A28L]